ncbi:MAG TPA: beta-ketoacyl synthase N-terminal-like domain-containing protein, partial [Balneolaceae bacterium]|nr:beta-ketoacyl synthase N-terminal-like domain-containing protein [Balneolaceae bacterium]
MGERRVVVTGMGALTPIGKNVSEFWDGLVSGKSGTHAIEHFDTTDFPTKFAAEISDYDSSDYFDRREARRMDKVSQYGLVAAQEALEDSGIDLDAINKDRVAVIVGTGIGGMITFYEQAVEFHEYGPRGVSPFFIPKLIPDMVAGNISIK